MTQPPKTTRIIPLVDLRHASLLDLLRGYKHHTLDIMHQLKSGGLLSRLRCAARFRLGDAWALKFLKKTNDPYRAEIESFAREKDMRGIAALNMSYEWGCTTAVAGKDGRVTLLRVLDWDYPALGENLVVAHQQGPAGEFHNITWPGLSGVFNALAAGRFAAAINRAPEKKTSLPEKISGFFRKKHVAGALPPAHLLRHVFENARDYAEAKEILKTRPVTAPVIYTLAGINPGEGCVIERTEEKAVVREMMDGQVCTANHFNTSLNDVGRGWTARTEHSPQRQAKLEQTAAETGGFAWFQPPVANENSRVAFVADAATGKLELMGTNGASPVTEVFRLPAR
jgi:hypothetical protein